MGPIMTATPSSIRILARKRMAQIVISQSSLRITLPILILLLFLAGPASAGDDRMRLLAEKSDGEIRELLAAQLPAASRSCR